MKSLGATDLAAAYGGAPARTEPTRDAHRFHPYADEAIKRGHPIKAPWERVRRPERSGSPTPTNSPGTPALTLTPKAKTAPLPRGSR